MTAFRVWAPDKKTVSLQVRERRFSMQPLQVQDRSTGVARRGWWQVDLPEYGAGTDYAFLLDDDPQPLPDPRSPWQPLGVHGPSRVVDHAAFPWTDAHWQAGPLASAVIYELHVGTFTPEGTFAAAIPRLDHLVDLGITHVELLPVNAFPGHHGWGYDGVALYAPHQPYGGPEGLKRLVDACHGKGLAVILDVVYNHLGPDGNYLPRFGPYLTDRYATPWGQAINFDGPDSDEVRRFFIDNARMWLRDYHIDGLRLDAVHAIVDTSAVHILEALARETEALENGLGRHLILIAESNLNDPRIVRAPEVGGYGIDAQWSDDFHHALHTLLTGEQQEYYIDYGAWWQLAKALRNVFVYDGSLYSEDRKRTYGRPPTGLPGYHFVSSLQNHDQVGNRAQGDRLNFLVDEGSLRVAAALLLTSPYVPLLFQGEEWGASSPFLYFTDHQNPELADAVREGRQKEFAALGETPEEVPDPQASATFERSKLDWEEVHHASHAALLDWYRRLIHLRHSIPTLRDGNRDRLTVTYDAGAAWLVVQRHPIHVACNLAEDAQEVPLGDTPPQHKLLASDAHAEVTPHGVWLPPKSVAVLTAVMQTPEAMLD